MLARTGASVHYSLTSNVEAAEEQMANFENAISNYRLQNKKLPNTLEELTETSGSNPRPFIQSIPDDPWGNPYDYRTLGPSTFQIRSNGEDGVPETEDDIAVWSMEDR